MTVNIKKEFALYARETLGLPDPGIASSRDFSSSEQQSMRVLVDYIKTVAGAPPELQRLMQPREMLGGLHSIIIVAVPNYMAGPDNFSQCRAELRGALSPAHLSSGLAKRVADVHESVTSFFADRGHVCRPLPPNAPLKIFAARSGIGFYGKNSMIINEEYGSWIFLAGYATDARLAPDSPVRGDCGDCTLCMEACPAGALDQPYSCAMQSCLNFQLQSKNSIPEAVRPLLKNGLAYGACRLCRDLCPHNRKLVPFADPGLSGDMLAPRLLEIVALDDARWERDFAATRMGRIMQDRRYVIRNALIALGNFGDGRACDRIARELDSSDPLIREYAAWALGSIGDPASAACLQEACGRESCEPVLAALHAALEKVRPS